MLKKTKGKPTYAETLAKSKNPNMAGKAERIHQDVMARSELQRRQFILDGDESLASNELTPKEMLAKANLALEQLKHDNETNGIEHPEGAKFIAVRALKNGGVLLEMDSEEGADWLRDEDITKEYEKQFPGVVKVKGKTYQVVVQFISTRLKDRLETMTTDIEEENDWPEDTIIKARWMRNPTNWKQTQSKAHAVLSVPSRGIANSIMMKGILIEGTRHQARKLEEDPRRCFKCQLIGAGHTAATCGAADACSNCAGQHATGDCRAIRADFRCVTCKKNKQPDDHASWDRQCPAFLAEKAKLRERRPENYYKYYPTEGNAATWVTHEECLGDGSAERWMGNENGATYNRTQAASQDSGWGKALGNGRGEGTGKLRRVDRYMPNNTDTWVPSRSQERPSQRRNRQETTGGNSQATRSQTNNREDSRSKSRGRTSQKTKKTAAADPRQRSITDCWSGDRGARTGQEGERMDRDRHREQRYSNKSPERR